MDNEPNEEGDVLSDSNEDKDEDHLAEVIEEIKVNLQDISASNFINEIDNQPELLFKTTELDFDHDYDETRGGRVENLDNYIQLGTNILLY